MKKVKLLFIILSMLMLSGCTVYYDLNIDENLNINEHIYFKSKNVVFDENSSITKGDYDSFIDNVKSNAKEYNYQFIDNSSGNMIDINLKKTTSFLSYKAPVFLENKYENFNTSCTEKFCSLTASVIEETIIGEGDLVYYNIGITVPYEVVKNNAKYHDIEKNTYYWYHSPIDEPKNIEIVFKRDGRNVIKDNETKMKTKSYIWVIIGTIVLIGIGFIVYKVIKNNKPRL